MLIMVVSTVLVPHMTHMRMAMEMPPEDDLPSFLTLELLLLLQLVLRSFRFLPNVTFIRFAYFES
jgi:hypothetical protein